MMTSDLTLVVFGALCFLAAALLVDGGLAWWRANRSASARRVRARIERINSSATSDPLEVVESVVRVRPLSTVAGLNRLLEQIQGIDRLDNFLRQARVGLDVGQFLGVSALCGVSVIVLAVVLMPNSMPGLLIAPVVSLLPWLVIQRRQEERLKRFNEQLPDALDAMARALKAGYSVVGAMKVVGEEMPAPLGQEFSQAHDEITFGISPQTALNAMTERIASEDLRFMVIAVLIQRETGGNLADILGKISSLMRQRLRLTDQIKTLSADGRMSAWVLCLLPFGVTGILFFSNRTYVETLWATSAGRSLLMVSGAMMLVGVIWIRSQIRVRF